MAQCLPFYSYCSTLTIGCYLYTDIKRTATVAAGWVSDGTTSYQVNSSGVIIATAACQFDTEWAGAFLSETGQYQIVINVTTGYLWESSDYGSTWAQNTSAGSKPWKHISISSNGLYRVATTSSDLFVSSNGGLSYSGFGLNSSSWVGTAISDDGSIMYASMYGVAVYKSTNYGGTFNSLTSLGSGAWQFPSTSSNGQWVLVPDSNYSFSMKRSENYGSNWSITGPTPGQDFETSAMSNNGQYQIAGNVGGVGAYVSSDYGASFTLKTFGNGYVKYFASAAMSGSGQFMLMADEYSNGDATDNGWVWRSTNYGLSFSKVTALGRPASGTGDYWKSVGFGGTYALAVSSDNVYRSTDSGASWINVFNPSPYPAYGTYIDSQCVGCDLYAFRADGNGGTYQAEVLQYNTEVCCFTGGGGGGGGGGIGEIQ